MRVVKRHLTDETKDYPVDGLQNVTAIADGHIIVNDLNEENTDHDYYYELVE